jgi:hypothetical protein
MDELQASIPQLILLGDSINSAAANNATVIANLTEQNQTLMDKKKELEASLDEKHAAINRYNRDFADVRKEVKDSKEVPNAFNFIEDYTLAFLLFAYIFMVVAFIFYRVLLSDSKLYELFYTSLQVSLVTILFSAFMYYLLN